jgi:hypothetical protein
VNWQTYWRDVVAPKLKARKAELGRAVSEQSIAYDVAQATGQDSSRSLLAMWLHGAREPTVSQFMALCERMGISGIDMLQSSITVRQRTPLKQISDVRADRKSPYAKHRNIK